MQYAGYCYPKWTGLFGGTEASGQMAPTTQILCAQQNVPVSWREKKKHNKKVALGLLQEAPMLLRCTVLGH